MKWFQKLERKFGRYAIPNLMNYIIILYVIGFVVFMMGGSFYMERLSLNAQAIFRGEVWRIFTFLIQPPSTDILFVLISLYLYYMIGKSLEATWGAFRFNVYFLSGVVFHVIAAIVAYLITGIPLPLDTGYLNLSLFFAFAATYPNHQFYLFFVIPVKVKYLAIVNGIFFAYTIFQGFQFHDRSSEIADVIARGLTANALAAAISILNFAIFFLIVGGLGSYAPAQIARKRNFKSEVRKAKFERQRQDQDQQHRCTVCGKTEQDDPNLEFRYCSKCEGNHEYCQEHLFTHQHITHQHIK